MPPRQALCLNLSDPFARTPHGARRIVTQMTPGKTASLERISGLVSLGWRAGRDLLIIRKKCGTRRLLPRPEVSKRVVPGFLAKLDIGQRAVPTAQGLAEDNDRLVNGSDLGASY